ncbi:6722_t:CDS:2, partial [Acaulospora colombiana]
MGFLDRRVPTFHAPTACARVLLVWLIFTQVCTNCNASLFLHTSDISWVAFSTVDFMWVNSCDYGYINGSLKIASFLDDGSAAAPCTLKSVPENTSILLVPFDEGLNNGCSSYSDVISRIKATRNLSEELNYQALRVRKLCRAFLIGLFFVILIKIVATIISLFEFAPTVNIMGQSISRLLYIVMELIFTFFGISTYSIFGMTMVLARKHERVPIRQNANAQVRKARTNREIAKSVILTTLLILSLLFITVHTIFTISLSPTVHNFWVIRFLDDISFVLGCFILVIALQYDSVGKYSHMVYSGSSDENAAESTISPSASRDSSFHNSNNSGTEVADSRGKRNT